MPHPVTSFHLVRFHAAPFFLGFQFPTLSTAGWKPATSAIQAGPFRRDLRMMVCHPMSGNKTDAGNVLRGICRGIGSLRAIG